MTLEKQEIKRKQPVHCSVNLLRGGKFFPSFPFHCLLEMNADELDLLGEGHAWTRSRSLGGSLG